LKVLVKRMRVVLVVWWPFGSGRRVLLENEFVVLYEQGPWYVIENKLVKDLPIVHRGETKTLVHMIIEMGMYPNGDYTVVRVYYPKADIELKVVVRAFYTSTNYWKKKLAEYMKMKEVIEKAEKAVEVSSGGGGGGGGKD